MKEIAIGINEAKRDLEEAENIFNYATNHDDIDTAIYKMLAAESNINKLIKLAKSEANELTVKGVGM